LLTVALAITACQADRHPVENPGPGTQQRYVISTPAIDIHGETEDSDPLLAYPVAATRLSSGTIIVADAMTASVRYFDTTGHLVRSVGRRGEGPGEFQAIGWLGQCAEDTVFVWDFMQARVTVLNADGTVSRMYRLPADPDGSPPSTIGCNRHGVFAVLGAPDIVPGDLRARASRGEDEQFADFNAQLSVADAAGNTVREVGSVGAGEFVITGGFLPRPLGRRTVLAVSDRYLFVGTADSGTVDAYTVDGEFARTVSTESPRRLTTDAHHERAAAGLVAWVAEASIRDAMRRRFLRIPRPEYLPHYSALFADPAGYLWAQLSAPGDGETWLRVIDAARGEVRADLHLPLETRVLDVGADYVIGTYEDQSGEPHVVLYRMTRTST
jgi:hypothetical protein